MCLEQAFYIGELIAAVVVLTSLIYLAIEVGRNTRIALINTSQANTQILIRFQESVCSNGEVAHIYRCGLNDVTDLAPDEQMRFYNFIAIMLGGVFHLFQG